MTDISDRRSAPLATTSHPLLSRISALRNRVRALVALFGMSLAVAGLVAAAIVLAMLDYAVHFPPAVRVFLLVAVLIGLGVLLWRELVRPLSQPLSEEFLATRVERVNAGFSDELVSAVDFIHAGLPYKNPLANRLVEHAAEHSRKLKFEDALDAKPALRVAGVAGLLVAIGAVLAIANPGLAHTSLLRWFDPTGDHRFPQVTSVTFNWADGVPAVLPQGERVTVRAVVTRGFYPNMHVWLYNGTDAQPQAEDLMTAQYSGNKKEAVFEKVLEPAGNTLTLRLAAGDDTEEPAIHIRLAPRPVVDSVRADITPPAYVKAAAPGTAAELPDLLQHAGRAIESSTVRLLVDASKPFASAGGMPELHFIDPGKDVEITFPHTSRFVSPTQAEVTFAATQTLNAQVVLRDTDGFDNRVRSTATLEVTKDALPSVIITDPRRSIIEVSPDATIHLGVRASDDLGVSDLNLRADNFDARPTDAPRFTTPLPVTQTSFDATTGVTAVSDYDWELSPLHLKPGDRITAYALVRDNYEIPSPGGIIQRHPFVKSAAITLQVLTKEQIEDRMRHDLQSARQAIQNLLDQQARTNDQTKAIQKAAQNAGVTTPQQKEKLGALAGQQAQEQQRAATIAQQVEQVLTTARQNHMENTDLGTLAKEAAAGMKDVDENNMHPAQQNLSDAQQQAANQPQAEPNQPKSDAQKQAEKASADATAKSTAAAASQQANAMSTMQRLIDQLGATGDVERFREEVRATLDEQNAVEDATRKLAAKTIGQDPSALPPDQKAQLDQIQNRQEHLAKHTSDLIDQMRSAANNSARSDPASSESLSKAADAGEKNDVAPAMHEASNAVGKNQMTQASNSQTSSGQGLQAMLDELDQQNKRELEQLALQYHKLVERLREIIKQQTALDDATAAAGKSAPAEVLNPLGDRQSRVQSNTLILAGDAEKAREAKAASGDLRDASDSMTSVTVALLKASQPEALPPETAAIASLNEALKKLQQLEQKTQEKLHQESLAQLQKIYEGLRTRQTAIQTATRPLSDRRAQRGELLRPDQQLLAKHATQQDELANDTAAVDKKYNLAEESPVMDWMNGLVVDAMNESHARMARTDLGQPLADAQQNAIDRLTDIIEAIKEEKKKPSPFSGQSGGGGGGKQPLVPPLAQLKLLRAMQGVVNRNTVQLDKQIASATDDGQKNDLKQQAAKLGQTQDQIKNLAERLIKKMSR